MRVDARGCWPRVLTGRPRRFSARPPQHEEFDRVRISTATDRPEDGKIEVDLEATAEELTSLYQALGRTDAELAASDDSNPEPGALFLTAIEISRLPGSLLRISVDRDRRVLQIVGGERETRSFAANVLDIATETPVGTRQHFKWFRDHFYLAPDTASLTVSLMAGTSSSA
jgi:hypothetical protein